ncbi:hypothetical protein EDB84DRAFT_1537277 [Lactarius hengduanensis]|nr:hypothetical protein EDB84DRAFT_1537277 [Lactarius hengduanensis]
MTVMFQIVEDASPPTPERFSSPLCSSVQPGAEQLFEYEDRIPLLRRVSADLQKNGSARPLMANLELDSPIPVQRITSPP